LHPQVLVCRTEHPIDQEVRKKLSVFCNVPLDAVVEARDVEHTIYEMPLMLQAERLDETVCRLLGLQAPPADMERWTAFVRGIIHPSKRARIAVVGKYIGLQDAYKSIYESLTHAGAAADCGIDLIRVDAEDLETGDPERFLGGVAGVLVPGGFGERGVEGKIRAAQYARETGIPYLGLCLGMQVATIEFARNVCGLKDANSTEFDEVSPNPVIHLLEAQKDVTDKGASMRLGTWPTEIRKGSKASEVYGCESIRERHRHRYEFNQAYREQMEAAGFLISGTSPDGTLAELIELRDHPWFLACQYHPEFQSKPNQPHPLFFGFVKACAAGVTS
jgi:CTP synthase